ncbi:MAG: formate dehydrogenase subunit gamma [Gaiellaceae bacterium]
MSEPRTIMRFGPTERLLHWFHAGAFFVLLATGLGLYLPSLAALLGRRPVLKSIHLWTSVIWAVGIVLIVLLGDRGALRRDAKEIDGFDADDRFWLRGHGTPQGRFNAGQKINAIATAAFAVLFGVSGLFLWLGERDTAYRWGSTILLHDGLTLLSVILLSGHLYLAVIHPKTRHSLQGMVYGDVDEAWARAHHVKWVIEERLSGR